MHQRANRYGRHWHPREAGPVKMLRNFLGDCRATAAAEMALIVPAIAFIGLNVADMSVYLYTKMQVDLAGHEAVGAARVLCATGAQLPAKQNCGVSLDSTMLSAAQSTTLGTNVTLGTSSEAFYCATTGAVLTQVAAYNATPPADCSGTVATSTAKPGDYISVTASYPFTSIFPGASIAASLPATITRTAWMRLK
jgi:Flp pilus assembly protein TadG